MRLINRYFPGRSQAGQSGFTLLEALVALVIFSIALLGLASLYAQSLIVSHGSYLRSLASIQASDMAERIYANPLVVIADPDDPDYSIYTFTGCDAVSSPSKECDEAACDVNELAEWDAHEWCQVTKQAFGALLEEGDTTVQEDGNDLIITIEWLERKPESRANADEVGGSAVESTAFEYRMRQP